MSRVSDVMPSRNARHDPLIAAEPPTRRMFAPLPAGGGEGSRESRVLQLLVAQDGSTTRLCETVAGGPVSLQIISQTVTDDVPATVRDLLPGARFIERITSLVSHGEVMTDNLTYVSLEGLGPDLHGELQSGARPIGHLLSSRWVRREPAIAGAELLDRLWRVVGQPDTEAVRCYRMATFEGPSMLICETFRRGMLIEGVVTSNGARRTAT